VIDTNFSNSLQGDTGFCGTTTIAPEQPHTQRIDYDSYKHVPVTVVSDGSPPASSPPLPPKPKTHQRPSEMALMQ
jgi:hypothetical protein